MIPTYSLTFPADRLFAHAVRILDDAGTAYGQPFPWTMGGGTAMALRHDHRYSRDIDIFLPDPQYLGHLTPRLSEAAAQGEPDYEEAAEYVKLRYPEGEVDFIVSLRLTEPGVEDAVLQGRPVRLETDIEIVAKKLRYRGDRFAARDVFDLAFVLEHDEERATQALIPWARAHRAALERRLSSPAQGLRRVFETIDARGYRQPFDEALARVRAFVAAIG